MTLGKGYDRCIFSLFSYVIFGVFISTPMLYNLEAESDALEVL